MSGRMSDWERRERRERMLYATALVRRGAAAREVAREFGVCERTVRRWVAEVGK